MATGPRLFYQQGDHVCTLYSTREEQLVAAVEYLRAGLARGERCLYVCCEHELEVFRSALRGAGIHVDEEERRGALILLTKHDGHLAGGSFDPAVMIARLAVAVKEALDAGFAGLCAAGDMNWLLDEAPGSERIAEYEALLNAFYASHEALGLCLYNRTTMPAALLDHAIATHRFVRVEGPILLENPFYEDPEVAQSRTAAPGALPNKLRTIESSRAQ